MLDRLDTNKHALHVFCEVFLCVSRLESVLFPKALSSGKDPLMVIPLETGLFAISCI